MCTGRLDLALVMRAFLKGADGVLIMGCHLNECNYITHGNFHALGMVHMFRKVMEKIGVNPDRLKMELVSGSESTRFTEIINEYSRQMREMGPIAEAEGLEKGELKAELEAANRLIPYMRLVERERLRVPLKTEADFERYFAGEEFKRLFEELVGEKLAMSRIMLLLNDGPLATGDIAKALHLTPSEVSRHINNSTRQGLIKFDEESKRHMLA